MNSEWVLQNLRETANHIENMLKDIEGGNQGAFCESGIVAIYRDLNRAWNGRNVPSIKAGVADETLCRFPTDLNVAD